MARVIRYLNPRALCTAPITRFVDASSSSTHRGIVTLKNGHHDLPSVRSAARSASVPVPTARRGTPEYCDQMAECLLGLLVAGVSHRLSGTARERVLILLPAIRVTT